MSLDRLLSTNTVTIVKPTEETTRYRDTVTDFDFVSSATKTTGWLTQVSTVETIGVRDVVTTGWKLYLHAGEEIAAADKVFVDNCTWYEVDGEPVHAQTPRGPHHIECVLQRVVD